MDCSISSKKQVAKMSKQIPKIRFKQFTDEWEQRKLGDYLSMPTKEKAKIKNSNDLMTVKLNLGGVYLGSNRETLEFGATTYYKRKAGQLIYGKQNFFNGSIAIIPDEFDGKATSGDVPSLDIHSMNSLFLYTYISRESYWKEKESKATGTGSKRIHEKTLLDFDIKVPTLEEQQKIGKLFKQLDDNITLHQAAIQRQQRLKKAMLQNLFPINGSTIPTVRFASFSEEWEQRKFSKIVNRVSKSSDEQNLPRVEYEDIVSGQGVLNKDIFEKSSEKKGTEFLPGDTLYGKLRPYLKNWLYADFKGIAVGDFWVLRPLNSNDEFVYSLIQSDKYQLIANQSSGTKMPRSDWSTVSNTDFFIPKNMDEQKKIGEFFKALENSIDLHQQALEKLKLLKKSLLQKMFI